MSLQKGGRGGLSRSKRVGWRKPLLLRVTMGFESLKEVFAPAEGSV